MLDIQSNFDLSNLSFDMITDYHRRLIENFLISKDYCSGYKDNSRYRLLAFVYYLESIGKEIKDIDYTDIANFFELRSNGISGIHLSQNFNSIKLFTKYLFEEKIIKTERIANSFSIDNAKYIESIIYSLDNNQIELLNCISIVGDFEVIVNRFISKCKENCNTRQFKFAVATINRLCIFLDFIEYKISIKIIDYWIENILGSFIIFCADYRKVAMRFYDFLLNDYVDFKKTYRKNVPNYIISMPEWAKNNFDKYITYRRRLGLKENTIGMDCRSIYRLVKFMDDFGISKYSEITPSILLKFHNEDYHTTAEGKNAYQVRIKNFLLFLSDEKIISNYHELTASLHPIKTHHKIVEVIPDDIVKTIYNHADDFKTPLELRSYAVFLLGIRLGLRRIDIANLRISNLDFNNLTLHFSQVKTLTDVILPIPVPVANAIFKYLKNGRQVCNHDYIFNLFKFPYDKIDAQTCNRDIATVYRKIGYNVKSAGFHITRKTYASNNLRKTHSLSSVSDSLGHTSSESVKKYISIDNKYMSECTIGLSSIKIDRSFYEL